MLTAQREALKQGATLQQQAYHGLLQMDVLIAQGQHLAAQQEALLAQGDRMIELLSYLADRAYDEGRGRDGGAA